MYKKNLSISSFERYFILEDGIEFTLLTKMFNWEWSENMDRTRIKRFLADLKRRCMTRICYLNFVGEIVTKGLDIRKRRME